MTAYRNRPIKSSRTITPSAASTAYNDLRLEIAHTDAANAGRFIEAFGGELLFVPEWKKWLSWDGTRWCDDSGMGVHQFALHYANSLWTKFALIARGDTSPQTLAKTRTFVKRSNHRKAIEDFIKLASFDPRLVTRIDSINAKPTLLNVRNGTLDLDSPTLNPHNRGNRLTQIAAVDFVPGATCPEWQRFLNLIFKSDSSLVAYVQQLLGYSISGLTDEHVLPICWGVGFNGKSTLWNTIVNLLGDYATMASQDLLMPKKYQHPTEIAHLYQKRFVAIGEPEQGRALNESRAKELTGELIIAARRMREDFWTFRPTHTLWLSTNHKPIIRGTDEGIWRRIKVIPFEVDLRRVTKPKAGFSDWLVANEGPGILNWLLDGFASWRQTGFREPQIVTSLTDEYRKNEDKLGLFIQQHCEQLTHLEVRASDLFDCYRKHGGELTQRLFGEQMAARFERRKQTNGLDRNKYVYRGIAIIDDRQD